jgi:hypothetical protein
VPRYWPPQTQGTAAQPTVAQGSKPTAQVPTPAAPSTPAAVPAPPADPLYADDATAQRDLRLSYQLANAAVAGPAKAPR